MKRVMRSFLDPVERFREVKMTARHWRTVQRLARKHAGRYFLMHDVFKALCIIVLGDRAATLLHRRFSGHHLSPVTGDIRNKAEAAIDWESARFDKPDKPLTAYETWLKYYSSVDMESTLKELGLWPTEGKP